MTLRTSYELQTCVSGGGDTVPLEQQESFATTEEDPDLTEVSGDVGLGSELSVRYWCICCPCPGRSSREARKVENKCPSSPVSKWGRGFPGGAVVKDPPANAGDMGLSPGPGRSHMPQSN